METANLNDNLAFDDDKIRITSVLETGSSKEIRIALKAGQEMREHNAPRPIVVELFRGKVDFFVHGEKLELEEGALVALAAKVPHSLLALEDSVVRLTLHKADSVQRVGNVPFTVHR